LNSNKITLDELKAGCVLTVNKPVNWTSFDVVNYIRKSIDVKIGHAGTLDPLATGLLILCTGKMTKQIDNFQGMDKEYTGTIILGQTTPSFDLETQISDSYDASKITNQQITDLANAFIGKQNQIAPLYSAKKIDGERAYLKARRGEEANIKAREIEIKSFEILEIIRLESIIEVNFKVVCSKGTYIRAIARDFGKNLENVAYLKNLIRTKIGNFHLSNAISLQEFKSKFPAPIKSSI
jgi:tRNA pseudouridine55 synthase